MYTNISKSAIDPNRAGGNQLTRYLENERIIRDDDKSIQLFERNFNLGLVNIDHSSLQLDHAFPWGGDSNMEQTGMLVGNF